MRLMILDGNSIVNRAYYGVRPLNAPDGTPTNAIFGFLNILQHLLDEQAPDALCVSFDLKAPTFRHKAYDGYKAQRKPMPEELAAQMPILKEMLDAMGIRRYEKEGYEADDILGTVSVKCRNSGWDCTIVTGDKDSLQLISETTSVCHVKSRMGRTETILYTPEVFRAEYGFEPRGIIDLKALMGDSSDNIPGVPGIGEKTALDLIQRYHSVDEIYQQLPTLDIKDGVRKKLAAGEASARQSYWLATILCEVPMDFSPEENRWHNDFTPALYPLCKRLGFTRFIERWGLAPAASPVDAEGAAETLPRVSVSAETVPALLSALGSAEMVAVLPDGEGLASLELCDGKSVYSISYLACGGAYEQVLDLLLSAKVSKTAHALKELMNLLVREGRSFDGFCFDTALAAYLLEATENTYELPRLTQRYLGHELTGAEAVFRLTEPLRRKLADEGMTALFTDIELPLCQVLCEMEQAGFLVDRKALYDFGESLNGSIAALQQEICHLAGHEFNILSPKQLGEVLFDELLLPYGKKTKTGWSTNADVLEKLRGKHPIVEDVLDYRMLTKLKSTYADGLLKVIADDGRIHTSFQNTVTATGRLSSTEPNLQNIPIRKELGAQIRQMFVAAPGCMLVDADYSQIELRLLAHISGDKAMQEAFLSGEDFHAVTASHVFNVPLDEVTPVLRSRAKAVNFGIVYGISAFSLSQDIKVSTAEAKLYMDAYMDRFHGVRDYMKNIVEQAKADGYVSTLYGRRRSLPELRSSNFNLRSFGERVALNMPIQGTAADIIKLAMVKVDRRLKAEGLKARLILQVHDELIVECPEAEAETVREILRYEMEHVGEFAVPLLVEANIAHSWSDAH